MFTCVQNTEIMALKDALIAEYKMEAARTRKILERVPLDKADWKPHEKSMTLGRMATHIAEIPTWTTRILDKDYFDFMESPATPRTAKDREELLSIHDENVAKAIASLEATNDEQLAKEWSLKRGEHVLYQLPKKLILRDFGFNHIYHHRGQLSVYLRHLDVPVPGMYGPSADER